MAISWITPTWTVSINMEKIAPGIPPNWQSMIETLIIEINQLASKQIIGAIFDLDAGTIMFTFEEFNDADSLSRAFESAYRRFVHEKQR